MKESDDLSIGRHVIKFTHDEGVKMDKHELWCGADYYCFDFHFIDAQHVALAAGGSIQPCKECIKEIIKVLESEL